jgi:hypothetical protein
VTVKGWDSTSAGQQVLVVMINKEIQDKRVQLSNRKKERYLIFNAYINTIVTIYRGIYLR